MPRDILFRVAGGIAVLLSLAATAFIVLMVVSLTVTRRPIFIIALAAATTQVLALAALVYLVLRHIRPKNSTRKDVERAWDRRVNHRLLTLGITTSTLAGLVTAATLGWTEASVSEMPGRTLGLQFSVFLLCTFIIWGVSFLAQVLFYVYLVRVRERRAENLTESFDRVPEELPQMKEPSRPGTSATTRSNPFREPPFSNLPSSPTASDGVSSLRSSLSEVVRPGSSKMRLLGRQQPFARDSKRSSFDSPSGERMSQDDGFDSWDTSGVATQMRETVLHSSPLTKGSGLEPIPGSRSPSPATALEGPFFQQSPTSSPPSSPLPNFSRPGLRQRSASSEDHIHPLFRPSSPVPPPNAMRGTMVTAAPLAGQLISQQTLSRMRSGSLPSSPSPLIQSRSYNDMDGLQVLTPPSREMTPPIPDFILSAGARTSLLDYDKRRLPLQWTKEGFGHAGPDAGD
ncbi:hypothetical protein MMC12_002018 [Toensbergia leucococca]|nr:hypothetical protein [Toensbergia leucococca]